MRDLASETRMPKPRALKPGCLKPERRLGAENGESLAGLNPDAQNQRKDMARLLQKKPEAKFNFPDSVPSILSAFPLSLVRFNLPPLDMLGNFGDQ
jgi:hypothetical protein